MKIKSYPGRAVEANLSLDKHSSMGHLYEANWVNANERIGQTHPAYSKSHVNISSLGKYQNNLEHIKALEEERKIISPAPKTFFNGYKPSTLRSRKNLKEYNEWDSETTTPADVIYNPLYNHAQDNWHSSDYLTNNTSNLSHSNKRTDPKIRRSQTVIVKQPLSKNSESYYHTDVQGDIDLRDFYRRRNQLRQNDERHQSFYSKNFTVHEGASNRIDDNGIQKNCDSMSDNNESLHRDGSNDLSALNHSHNDIVNNSSTNRMNCYKTLNFSVQNKSYNFIGESPEKHAKANVKVLLNPLARNKSIKINHFDMVATADEPQKLKPEEIDGKLCDTNGKSGKKVKKSSLSRMFYNTISAGSKFPRVFLGRNGKSQRAKLNLEELSETAESQQSNSSVSTLSSSSPIFSSSASPNNTAKIKSDFKHGSATSSDFDSSDSFVIPRPRLIVPVHTYARKRRTGNISNRSENNNCDRNKSKGK